MIFRIRSRIRIIIFDLLGVGVGFGFAFVGLGLGVGFKIFDSGHLCSARILRMRFLAMQLKKRADMPSNKLCPLQHIVGTDQGDTVKADKSNF